LKTRQINLSVNEAPEYYQLHAVFRVAGVRPAVRVASDHISLRNGLRRPEESRLRAVLAEVGERAAGRGAGGADETVQEVRSGQHRSDLRRTSRRQAGGKAQDHCAAHGSQHGKTDSSGSSS